MDKPTLSASLVRKSPDLSPSTKHLHSTPASSNNRCDASSSSSLRSTPSSSTSTRHQFVGTSHGWPSTVEVMETPERQRWRWTRRALQRKLARGGSGHLTLHRLPPASGEYVGEGHSTWSQRRPPNVHLSSSPMRQFVLRPPSCSSSASAQRLKSYSITGEDEIEVARRLDTSERGETPSKGLRLNILDDSLHNASPNSANTQISAFSPPLLAFPYRSPLRENTTINCHGHPRSSLGLPAVPEQASGPLEASLLSCIESILGGAEGEGVENSLTGGFALKAGTIHDGRRAEKAAGSSENAERRAQLLETESPSSASAGETKRKKRRKGRSAPRPVYNEYGLLVQRGEEVSMNEVYLFHPNAPGWTERRRRLTVGEGENQLEVTSLARQFLHNCEDTELERYRPKSRRFTRSAGLQLD